MNRWKTIVALGVFLAGCGTVQKRPVSLGLEEPQPIHPDDESAESRVKKAKLAMASGDIADTERLAKSVLQIDPKNADARLIMGRVFFAQGKYEAARMVLQDTLTAGQENADLHLWLAHSLRFLDDGEAALAEYEKAVALDGNSAEALDNLGLMLLSRGELERGRELLEKTASLLPQSAPVSNHVGNAALLLKRFDEAGVEYQKALRLDENLNPVYFNLGLLHLTGEVKDKDELAKLQASSDYFAQYLQKGNPDAQSKKRIEGYIGVLKQKILIETQRREREQKQKEEPPTQPAAVPATSENQSDAPILP